MSKVERWIRQKMVAAVDAGYGQWAVSPASALGKPIYHIADGSMMLTLSELGFSYEGPTSAVKCRYDEIEALELAPLHDIMRLRGNLFAPLTVGIIMRDASPLVKMDWPLRVYSNVATVLDRIVKELT